MSWLDCFNDEISLTNELTLIRQYIADNQRNSDLLKLQNKDISRETKNDRVAIKQRALGYEYYESNENDKYITALRFYNKSLAYATADSKELANGLWRRATFLFDLKKYKECLADCLFGLDINNASDNIKALLVYLKFKCLEELNDLTIRDCDEAVAYLMKLECPNKLREQLIESIESHVNKNSNKLKARGMKPKQKPKFEKKSDEEKMRFQNFAPRPDGAPNSKKIEASMNSNGNIFVKATADINPGEIIVIEKSYNTRIYHDYRYLFCDNCLNSSWNLMPCEGCSSVVYCSNECKNEHWNICHSYECKVYPAGWFCDHYLEDEDVYVENDVISLWYSRVATIAVLKAGGMDAFMDQIDRVKRLTDSNRDRRQYLDTMLDSRRAVSILGLKFNRDDEDEVDRKLALEPKFACIAVVCLALNTNFFGERFDLPVMTILTDDRFIIMGALIIRMALLLNEPNVFYSFAFNPHDPTSSGRFFGNAIHPFFKAIRHSCDANTTYITSNHDEVMVTAKRPIKKGSEVFINIIGVTYENEPKSSRQKKIYFRTNNSCSCVACLNNWPTMSSPSFSAILGSNNQTLAMQLTSKYRSLMRRMGTACASCLKYDQKVIREILDFLILVASKSEHLMRCSEYDNITKMLIRMHVTTLGNNFIAVANECQYPMEAS